MTEIKITDYPADLWAKALTLYDEVVELPPGEQRARLRSEHLPKPIRLVVERMLRSNEQSLDSVSILDKTIDPLLQQLLGEEAVRVHTNPDDIIGRTFGAWQATHALANGGMGQVFVAQRADGQFEKQAALKIIKAGGFSELSRQRFLEEMRTLARLEHPHIARLIDGGSSEDGIAYFVMELVVGEPITAYANQHQLSLNDRLKLCLQAMAAVEYAHQNLVIHGDIKPANVLVNTTGQVKLVDFGISRPLQNEAMIEFPPQFTPSHSSPEQARGKPLSTATDVFGLCSVLYELTTGSSPRERTSMTTTTQFDQSLEAPIEPALQRFRRHCIDRQLPTVSDRFRKPMDFALAHELGAIIDRGLHVESTQRYRNTTELSRELQLYMQGEVVPTYRNTSWYRAGKLWRKFGIPLTISALALAGIVSIALIALNQAGRASEEASKAQWSNQFLLSMFDAADPVKNQQQPISVNEITGLAADRILLDESAIGLKAEAIDMLGQIQYRLGEVQSAERLNHEHIRLLEQLNAPAQDLAYAHIKAGTTMDAQDKLADAEQHFVRATQLVPLIHGLNETAVQAALSLSNILIRLSRYDEASLIAATIEAQQTDIADLAEPAALLANLYVVKAKIALSQSAFQQAITELRIAKEYSRAVADDPMLFPTILGIEAEVYFGQGDSTKAADIDRQLVNYFSETFGKDHPETINNLGRLAVSLSSMGETQEAISIYRGIIDNLESVETSGHQIPVAYLNMGTAYQRMEDHQSAIRYYQQAHELLTALTPRMPLYEASANARMGVSLLAMEQYSSAESHFHEAIQTLQMQLDASHPMVARTLLMYAPLLLAQHRYEEAASIIPQAHQQMIDAYGVNSSRTALANLLLAQLNAARGDHQLAASRASEVLAILDVPELQAMHQTDIHLARQLQRTFP